MGAKTIARREVKMRYISLILIVLVFYSTATVESSKLTQNGQHNHQEDTSVIDRYGFEMVYVPEGTFEMGEDKETIRALYLSLEREYEIAFFSQEVLDTYLVSFSGFWIDKYEITVEGYQSLCQNSCQRIEELGFEEKFINDPKKPVVGVDWYDAMRFCNLRNARLPTEEEWEYAASGPDNFLFPWGNKPIQENITYSMVAGTYPVGEKIGNISWVGAYDMAGNLAEWVEDRYFPAYSFKFSEEHPASGSDEYTRVVRGGVYYGPLDTVTTYERRGEPADSRSQYTGFRCARTSDPRND
jgi:formylglycine-generating enzyme required for sulfatase activity